MPMPKPKPKETEEQFTSRFMADDAMLKEYPDEKQRFAVAKSTWTGKRNESMDIKTIKCNATLARTAVLDGVEYLVAPCVMINQGVHNGSAGPLFYPADELKKTVEAWNHKPVLVEHPTKNGQPASSCDPDVLERQKVGFLMNSSFEDSKLKTEIWLDKKKAKKIAPKMLQAVESGTMLEVSTGLFTDDEKVENAEWNGEKYVARTMNYRPDHLAILPTSKGACSIADGAGFPRLNEESGDEEDIGFFANIGRVITNMLKGKPSHSEIRMRIQKAVGEKLGKSVYIQDVFDGAVVYEAYMEPAIVGMEGTEKLYQAPWKDTKNGIEIGPGTEVVRTIEYTPVKDKVTNASPEAETKTGDDNMTREETINTIVANEQSPFGEDQREVLNGMTDAQLAVIAASAVVNEEEVPEEPETPETPEEPEVQNAEQVLEKLPTELRDMFASGLKLHKEKRASLVEAITKCKTNKFTKAQLEAMPTDTLQNMVDLIPAPADFSGQGPTPPAKKENAEKPEPLAMPQYKFE